MIISAYQINNVLRVYGDQIRHGRLSGKINSSSSRAPDSVTISSRARKEAVIDKITSSIIEKIAEYGPQENVEKEVLQRLEHEYGAQLDISGTGSSDLIFRAIDDDGETINSLSIEDSKFLRHRLEQITKDTVTRNMI